MVPRSHITRARCSLHSTTLLDTGHIVLTLVDKGGDGACPTAPSLWKKYVAAVWLQFSSTEDLIAHLFEGVSWADVWATIQQLALPAGEGCVGTTRVMVPTTMVPCARYKCGCGTYILVARWNLSTFNNKVQG